VRELVAGLWRWTTRHPEWHPGDFGAEVASYAVRAGDVTLLIDPLVTDGAELDAIVGDRVAILISIPYHVRSAEALAARYGAEVWGHPSTARRMTDTKAFRAIEPGAELPGGARGFTVGRPRRFETPLHLPSADALVFGDAVVEHGGELRVWAQDKVDAKVRRFHRERFNPTLEPLVQLGAGRILVTHGEPVLHDGSVALAAALRADPWYHRG
jgi:hypothetical protein